MRHLFLECRCEAWFLNFRRQVQRQMLMPIQMHRKMVFMPKCGIYLLNAALKRDLSISECKYKGKCKCNGKCIGKWFLCPKCGIYLLNWALKRDLSISEGKYKGECKGKVIGKGKCKGECKGKGNGKGKCIGKWFLCPKCCMYLLNAALKRIFSISECKYKGKCKGKSKALENGFYALNAAFISWMPLWSVICRFQNANTKANANATANA